MKPNSSPSKPPSNSFDNSLNPSHTQKSRFRCYSAQKPRQIPEKTPPTFLNNIDQSFYIPQTLSSVISISINSRSNIHSRSQPRNKKPILTLDESFSREINPPMRFQTTSSPLKRFDDLDVSESHLQRFRKTNFGINTTFSTFSKKKDDLNSTKLTIKPSRDIEEPEYNFEFKRQSPSKMTLKEYLNRIQPDVVPNIAATGHQTRFNFKPKTSSSSNTPAVREKSKPRSAILCRHVKASSAQITPSFQIQAKGRRKGSKEVVCEVNVGNSVDSSMELESLDKRCLRKYIKIKKRKGSGVDRVEKQGNLNKSIIEGERMRQEMYSDIERYQKQILSKIHRRKESLVESYMQSKSCLDNSKRQ